MNPVQNAIKNLVGGRDLTEGQAKEAMKCIMSGRATDA
ncbi:MAG TPA: anthranilate phosphoribosyltransferase, partial [Hadesarchaea archaeon]|nr:anthranilate phosphoribosyltransferase [Hadesarchaea archaeon]